MADIAGGWAVSCRIWALWEKEKISAPKHLPKEDKDVFWKFTSGAQRGSGTLGK